MRCLVTVGTTSFDDLIACINTRAIRQALCDIGITHLVIQYGMGQVSPIEHDDTGLDILGMRFHPNLVQLIHTCDIVIGHAGAGTILEALTCKPRAPALIVVVNDKLMNNHQSEIATALAEGPSSYLHQTIPGQLLECLKTLDIDPHINTSPSFPASCARDVLLLLNKHLGFP